jgi:hypothetical protein
MQGYVFTRGWIFKKKLAPFIFESFILLVSNPNESLYMAVRALAEGLPRLFEPPRLRVMGK